MALEGLGRLLRWQDGHQGDVYFEGTCKTVIEKFALNFVFDKDEIEALSRAHNKLVKHIGDVSADVQEKCQHTLHLGAVLADLLVGY